MEAKLSTKRQATRGKGRVISPVRIGIGLLVLNMVSIFTGIGYLIWHGSQAVWNVPGVLLLFTMVANIILANDNVQRWQRLHIGGKTMLRLSYAYTVFTILAMVGMMLGTFLISNDYSNRVEETIYLHLLVDISYFGLFALGILLAALRLFEELTVKKVRQKGWKKRQKQLNIAMWKGISRGMAILILAVGIFYSSILIFGGRFHMLEIMVPEFALFFGFIFFAAAFLLMQVTNTAKYPRLYRGTMVVGWVILVVCLVPLIMIPRAIQGAEREFAAAFGPDWRNQAEGADSWFRNTPFVLPAYFLGTQSKDYIVYVDMPFYLGDEGVDEGLDLRFDAYLPSDRENSGPGRNATLIRIHGGAWMGGDKGSLNMMEMNKYFASQGYTVFDIQYGLSTVSSFKMNLSAPNRVKGAFSVDDMVRHIGIFLGYLKEHAGEFRANLDTVFISGGSAGGQLTAAVGLGIADGRFANILGRDIKVKGIIPFYPANGIAQDGKLTGAAELLNPDLLVDAGSPPALIFQGTHDSLVPEDVAKRFQAQYRDAGNQKCVLLEMPLAGHASDLNFAGYYNQVFLYYMERFMYLCQQ